MLTGHVGAWELCAFAQGVYGHPLSFLVRPLDNPLPGSNGEPLSRALGQPHDRQEQGG